MTPTAFFILGIALIGLFIVTYMIGFDRGEKLSDSQWSAQTKVLEGVLHDLLREQDAIDRKAPHRRYYDPKPEARWTGI